MRNLVLVESVMRTPRIYTLEGTFDEALAFLNGYFTGLRDGAPDAPALAHWAGFRAWIARKLGVPEEEAFRALRIDAKIKASPFLTLREWLGDYQRENLLPTGWEGWEWEVVDREEANCPPHSL